MRLLAAVVAGTVLWASIGSVEAQQRRKESGRASAAERGGTSDNRRSTTVDRRGLCVRDNGRPIGSLDLNHTCDREEFWARFNDQGGDKR